MKAKTVAIPIRPAVLAFAPNNFAAPDATMRSTKIAATFFISPNEKEISHGRGVVANTLNLSRNERVGFIDWLDRV